jgi:tetratricopeptide (TPR) repeat protein
MHAFAPAHPIAAHAEGLHADGAALADGPARDALRLAMHQLGDAEARTDAGMPAARCHALTEAARALAGLHAYSPAESYLAQALRWAGLMGGPDLRADLQCALAEVATNAADLAQLHGERAPAVRRARDRARDHAFEAARLASQATDPHWEVKLLLRASDVLDRCGDHDDAVQLQQRALELMGLHNPDLPADGATHPAGGTDGLHLTAPTALM